MLPKHLLTATVLFALMSTVGCATTSELDDASASDEAAFSIAQTASYRWVRVEAGVDYPTDAPMPAELANKRILRVTGPDGYEGRIAIARAAKLSAAKAGIDYPTDAPSPFREGTRILVLGEARIPVHLERACAIRMTGSPSPSAAPRRSR